MTESLSSQPHETTESVQAVDLAAIRAKFKAMNPDSQIEIADSSETHIHQIGPERNISQGQAIDLNDITPRAQ